MKSLPIQSLLLAWYARPLTVSEAQGLALLAKKRLNKMGRSGRSSFCAVMMQTIADWWLDEENSLCLTRGIQYANTKRKMALYHLIIGQLSMSCKIGSALDYLDMGLRYADGLIRASDYFTLYNRHEELRYLPVSSSRQKANDLPVLLNESRVIRRLSQKPQYTRPVR